MIAASIVIYNSEKEELRTIITCVANSVAQMIYIVDNSPTDALRDFVAALSDKVIYLHGHGNVGFGAGHNIAIKKSIAQGAKYHLVLNPDIEFGAGVIEKLQAFMDAHANVGLVMPKVLYPDGKIQYLCKLLPTPFDLIFRRFLPFLPYTMRRTQQYELRRMDYSKIQYDVPVLSGCFMLLRTSALQQAGLFDERYFMYLEDFDLCRRIHRVAQTAFFTEVNVVHHYEKGSYKSIRLLRYHIVSAVKYFCKWGWLFDKERRRVNRAVLG